MKYARVCLVVMLLLSANVDSKRFDTRCKLVRELMKVGLPSDIFLGNWVCLIETVSKRDTKAVRVTPSGKKYYGLYQIPSRWCRDGKRGGECNIACESLLDDDIRDDTACAQHIFRNEGFKYWSQWSTRCKNNVMITQEIYKCPDLSSPRSSPDRVIRQVRRTRSAPYGDAKQSNLYSYYGIHDWLPNFAPTN